MIATIFDTLMIAATLAVAVVTALPFWRTHEWWVRVWDFPRAQIAAVAAALLILALIWEDTLRIPVLVALAACLIYQTARILPFTPLFPKEMKVVPRRDTGSQIRVLSANVEMGNDRHDLVETLIRETDADIVFLMETDQTWGDVLSDVLSSYPTVRTELRDNYYGMIFATRLKAREIDVVYLTQDDTPTLFAELETPNGRVFRLVGLHPRPPVPGNDTDDRDAEMLYAARFAHKSGVPLIAMGDFNDAAWSDSSRHFKKVGRYVDPRVGRGMVASFHAKSRLLRTPIDQFFTTTDVALVDFHRGNPVGSDHFPLIATIDIDRDLGERSNRELQTLPSKEIEKNDRVFEEYRLKLGSSARE